MFGCVQYIGHIEDGIMMMFRSRYHGQTSLVGYNGVSELNLTEQFSFLEVDDEGKGEKQGQDSYLTKFHEERDYI